jgi:hypothetical protein
MTTQRGKEMGHTCMHALATHPLTPLPASGRQNRSRRTPRTRRSRQRCASTEASIHRSSLASRPFPTVLLFLGRFLPFVSILSGASVFLLSPKGSRNNENHHHQSLPGTRGCWLPKWAPRSSHPREQQTRTRSHACNKHTLTRMRRRAPVLSLSRQRAKKDFIGEDTVLE